MDDKDVKEAALKQAQEAYGMFLSFMKWAAYIFIFLLIILAFFNFFDDPTGSRHLPEGISEQYVIPADYPRNNIPPLSCLI